MDDMIVEEGGPRRVRMAIDRGRGYVVVDGPELWRSEDVASLGPDRLRDLAVWALRAAITITDPGIDAGAVSLRPARDAAPGDWVRIEVEADWDAMWSVDVESWVRLSRVTPEPDRDMLLWDSTLPDGRPGICRVGSVDMVEWMSGERATEQGLTVRTQTTAVR